MYHKIYLLTFSIWWKYCQVKLGLRGVESSIAISETILSKLYVQNTF